MLTEFKPPPGIVHDGTAYSARGYWNDCDKARFRGGFPERIGGWYKLTSSVFSGVCRHLIQWTDLSQIKHIGCGTNLKYYLESSEGALENITPLRSATLGSNPIAITNTSTTVVVTHASHGLATGNRVALSGATAVGNIPVAELNTTHTLTATTANTYSFVVTTTASSTTSGGGTAVVVNASEDFNILLGNNPIATTNGSATVTITHTAHGAFANDYVTFDGATAINNVTIDGEYQIVTVVDANSYTIVAGTTANGTGSGGGAAVLAQYQINTGSADYSSGMGWGSGGWGAAGWGRSPTSISAADRIRLWTADTFGEDLVYCPRGGSIYYYDMGDQDTKGRPLNTLANANADTPTVASFVMVGQEAQRVFAFGCNPVGSSVQDPLLVRWSDDGIPGSFTQNDETTAGELRIPTGNAIMTAAKARGRTLVWTESSLHSIQLVEGFIYGLQLISANIDIVSPNCVAGVDEMVMWMGRENFLLYDGTVKTLPCPVRDYVFSDINIGQAWKIYASTNRIFREVWWFYPSASSQDIDRYVIYNYAENVWYYGTLARTAWNDAGILDAPIAASDDGYIYYQETGLDDGSTSPASGINAYVKSGPIQMGDGNQFSFVRRIIPDITFSSSSSSQPEVTYTLSAQNYPGGSMNTVDGSGGLVEKSASVPVEQWTEKVDVRLRGRQFMLEVSSENAGVFWRLGPQRFDVTPDGRR